MTCFVSETRKSRETSLNNYKNKCANKTFFSIKGRIFLMFTVHKEIKNEKSYIVLIEIEIQGAFDNVFKNLVN